MIHVIKVEKYLNAYCDGAITDDGTFDIVYIDPPYAYNNETHEIVDQVLMHNIINSTGIICVEHSKEYSPPLTHLFRQKLFGSTILSFIKPEIR